MGFIVLWDDKDKGIRLKMSNDCKQFTLINFTKGEKRIIGVEEIAKIAAQHSTIVLPLSLEDYPNRKIKKI